MVGREDLDFFPPNESISGGQVVGWGWIQTQMVNPTPTTGAISKPNFDHLKIDLVELWFVGLLICAIWLDRLDRIT